jgi:glycosyltransferase involved in cell wall biosynthesis
MDTYEQCLESYRTTGSLHFLVESITFQKGLEGPFELIKHYCTRGKHSLVLMYWDAVQNIVDNAYSFSIAYYVAISAKATKNIELTAQMCLRLFQQKEKMEIDMLPTILDFVKYVLPYGRESFSEHFYSFVDYVKTNHHDFDYIPKHTNSILFFVGTPVCPSWNYTYGLTNAVGGSEQAIRYLTQHFPEYNVYVCGNVIEEVVGNVHYVSMQRLGELVMTHYFKAIVLSRDISFLELCPTHYTDRILIMAHDTQLVGVSDIHTTLKKWLPSIKACVCLTKFHKELFEEQYPYLPITIIENGIEPSLFIERSKIPNRFLFTSCSERGLSTLLDVWPSILQIKPDASLLISSYQSFPRPEEIELKNKIDLYPSIRHVGALSPKELYAFMSTAEYWVFPSTFPETSCITAREMMASKVKCFYLPQGGIVETMGDFGVPIVDGKFDLFDTYDLDKAKQYALSFSWERSATLWKPLLETTIINLIIYRPIDYEIKMKEVQDTYIHSYPFVKSYYLTFREQSEEIQIEGDMVYVNGVEELQYITKKTFAFFRQNHIYDYMYRTNISTVTDFNALLKQLPLYYGGDKRHTYILGWPHGKDNQGTLYGLQFVEGSNIVLHKKAVHVLKQYNHDLDTYADDLIIAHLLKTKPTLLEPFIYRHKTDENRFDDVLQMIDSVTSLHRAEP